MAAVRAGFAVPQKTWNLPSAKVFLSAGHAPSHGAAIFFPGKCFHGEDRIFRERTSGSARLRWVSEYSEHRRPATRQRGFCGSSLEQSVADFSESRMMAEDGSFKIVRNPALPAPAQSTELPNVRWFRAVCQFR